MNSMQTLLEKQIEIFYPPQLVFGNGCAPKCIEDLISRGKQRIFVVVSSSVKPSVASWLKILESKCQAVQLWSRIDQEPTIGMFEEALEQAQAFKPDAILGIGGGSVLDVSKLVAALVDGNQQIREVIGIGKLKRRAVYLVCLPTTAGTGSEVSPNAIYCLMRKRI